MKAEELRRIAEREWTEGSFLPLLRGEQGCEAELTRCIPAAVPTDWSYVIEQGIYALYRKEGDPEIVRLFRADVERLLDGADPFSVWCGYNVCFFLLCKEREGRAPFQLMDDIMLDKLRCALRTNREKFIAARIWQGTNCPLGLWTDIVDSARVLEEKHGVRLLENEPDTPKAQPLVRGGAAPDLAALLGRKLQAYVEAQKAKKHSLPRAVRVRGMDIPHVDAPYGSFGEWEPERATVAASRRELEELFGFEIDVELYEYYRHWRFAMWELRAAGLTCTMDPLYETAEKQTNFFRSVLLNGRYYFKLGTARDDTGREYTLLCRNTGGVWLLEDEDETARPMYFAESISAMLECAG